MTAAHCLDIAGITSITLHAGEISTLTNEATEQTRTITAANRIIHPNWNSTLIRNDIGLMRLSSPWTFNSMLTIFSRMHCCNSLTKNNTLSRCELCGNCRDTWSRHFGWKSGTSQWFWQDHGHWFSINNSSTCHCWVHYQCRMCSDLRHHHPRQQHLHFQ